MELNTWLIRIKHHNHDATSRPISDLVTLIHSPPPELWSYRLSEDHRQAIAYWLDGCLYLFQYFDELEHHQLAYQYIQLAYARLQSITADPHAPVELRYWSASSLDRLTVMMLEFCQKSPDWQQESYRVIELHIAFMTPLGELNMKGDRYENRSP